MTCLTIRTLQLRYYELTQSLKRECQQLGQAVERLSGQVASKEDEVRATQEVSGVGYFHHFAFKINI